MSQNKLETISNLFEDKEIRSVWGIKREKNIIRLISSLTDSDYTKARNYL